MNDNIMISDEDSASEVVSKSEVTLATEIMLAMVKTSKGARMYQANNPLLVTFFQDLWDKMSSMLGKYSQYRLDVERFELNYKGHTVYENSDTKESIAFRMYSDGIRSVIFNEGVEEWEVRAFLETVNVSATDSLDDDIVTLLWDKGLSNCSYILEEDFQEIDRQIDEHLAGASGKGKIPPACLKEPASLAVQLQQIPDHLFVVQEEESSALQRFIESEEQLRPLDETARILSAILSGVVEKELFSAFLEIYLKFARNLFVAGESETALKMFAFLYRRTTEKEPSAERRGELLNALGRFWNEETLKGLCRIIDKTEAISIEGLKTIALMIGRTSPLVLCELLGLIEKMKMRKVLISATTDIVRDRPQLLLPYLKDSRWYLVRNMVLILSELKCTILLDQVVTLITHRELRVRKEVLKYLLTVPDPKAKPYLLKFLRDESSAIRIMAIQLMAKARLQFALKPLVEFVSSDAFELINISEKKAVYEAIAELGGEKVLPLFKTMLTRKFHFQRVREKEAVICAAAGLQRILGDDSLSLLNDALRSKSKEHHEVINNAIQVLTSAKPSRA